VRFLATREHSRQELERKLLRHHPMHKVAQVLDELAAEGLQSDQRFTRQYIHSRRSRGYGPVRIRAELGERGIASQLIAQTLETYDNADWQQLMQEVARRKFGSDLAEDRRELARRGRFLASRGFPSWMISDYLFRG